MVTKVVHLSYQGFFKEQVEDASQKMCMTRPAFIKMATIKFIRQNKDLIERGEE